jgi:hypothetical protein
MSDTKGMRALKTVTIVMGVLIVLGTVTLMVLLARRSVAPPAAAVATLPAGVAFSATLAEPEGTRIAGVSEGGDRLAVSLQGGGPDRVVLLDPHTGAVVGRVVLGH